LGFGHNGGLEQVIVNVHDIVSPELTILTSRTWKLNIEFTRFQVVNSVQRERKINRQRAKYRFLLVGRSNGLHFVVICPF
jgi:hypothetical protein